MKDLPIPLDSIRYWLIFVNNIEILLRICLREEKFERKLLIAIMMNQKAETLE